MLPSVSLLIERFSSCRKYKAEERPGGVIVTGLGIYKEFDHNNDYIFVCKLFSRFVETYIAVILFIDNFFFG